jgi:hypothetical protein
MNLKTKKEFIRSLKGLTETQLVDDIITQRTIIDYYENYLYNLRTVLSLKKDELSSRIRKRAKKKKSSRT